MKENRQPVVAPAKWDIPYADDLARPTQREQSYIVAFGVLTVIAWQTEIGTLALMPFTLLGTWFHEMAHGLAAMVLGASFERLVIYANGSGFAEYSGRIWSVNHAVIAAAGLLGPSIAGSLMIVASRSRRATRGVLIGLGIALAVTTLVWVRSIAGWIVLPGFAALSLYIALSARERIQRISIEFLGVQGVASLWQDLGYLFSDGAVIGGHYSPSDTGRIADALLLPYWVWGALITVVSLAMVWWALKFAAKY